MYCPVDGDEYREGLTRCPEHDVDLVEDPPELPEIPPMFDRSGLLRITFAILVLAAVTYAVAGAASNLLFGTSLRNNSDFGETPQILQYVSSAAFPVALGAVGVIGAALMMRAHTAASQGRATIPHPSDANGGHPGFGGDVMRILLTVLIVFTLLWAGTGVVTAKREREFQYRVFSQVESEPPEDSLITLLTLNTVAYFGGVACLAVMSGMLGLRAYERGGA